MWRKHRNVYRDHLKYICNDIVRPFHVGILRYDERVQHMHDLVKHLPPPLINGNVYEAVIWKFRNSEFSVDDIRVAIKDGLPSSMQDEFEDNQEEYCSLAHEDWCKLLSKIEIKDNSKKEATQIKKIDSAKAAYHFDRKGSVRIPRKNKSRTGFLHNNKGSNNKAPKYHGNQCHCVLARRQECLSKSICCIVLKNFLASVPTSIPSRTSWENLW